nr:PREDICTED: neurotrimin-like [Bemisia tabaci]
MDARLCTLIQVLAIFVTTLRSDSPQFVEPIANITVPVGREAVLACVVKGLETYKIAWLRVDTQTILTIHLHVITKNKRVEVKHANDGDRDGTWFLHIRDVKESDRGWYMCQINTDPMKSQTGYLQVVVPPDILDYPTSTDMSVNEGSNVTMTCAASGSPPPHITWRRETGDSIPLANGQEVSTVEGSQFNISRVNRLHMGPYLCIASNGIPPSVSKRIMLIVHFPPMIWIQNQLVGVEESQQVTLECFSEAYPKSINYWTREHGEIINHGTKYEPVLIDNAYKIHMKLTIRAVSKSDFGTYKCISKNSLGETDGTIKLYENERASTTTTIATTTKKIIHRDHPTHRNISEPKRPTPSTTSGKTRGRAPSSDVNTLSRSPETNSNSKGVADTDDAVRQKNKISTYIKDKDVSNSSSYIFGSPPLSIISFIVYCFFNVIM